MANFDKVIPPGQEGKIEMAVDGHKVHGNFSKSATVTSNDSENGSLTITLLGNEIAYVDMIPPDRIYLQGGYNETVRKSVIIRSNETDLDFKILDVSSNIDDKITYRVEDGVQKGEYELKVWKNPKLPTMSTFGTLSIHTNSEKSPEAVLQVQVITKGSISVTPSLVNFGRVKFGDGGDGKEITKSVTIMKADGDFKIRDLAVNSGRFEAKVSELVQGRTFRVDITFTPPSKSEPDQSEMGELTIYTTDPYEPSITVRLVARSM